MRLTVNNRMHEVGPPATATLLDVLRDELDLTGTKLVCDRGECGACTVLLDGALTYACLTLAAACEDVRVTTVEGLAQHAPRHVLAPLQRAFIAHDAAQCGFCTPGQLVAAHDLLSRVPHPTDEQIRDALSGNLCRCGTYPRIISAIRAVADGEFTKPAGDAP